MRTILSLLHRRSRIPAWAWIACWPALAWAGAGDPWIEPGTPVDSLVVPEGVIEPPAPEPEAEPEPTDSASVDSLAVPPDSLVAPADSVGSLPDPVVEEEPAPSGPLLDPATIPDVDVVVTVDGFGRFRIRPWPGAAPNHVAAFLSLAATGFYDGQGFHRVIPGYLVQAGSPPSADEDPWNDESGSLAWQLPEENSEHTHRRGVVSMAWRDDRPGTAGTQWFVSLAENPALDGKATPIGEVLEGFEVVEGVSQVTALRNRHPLRPVRIVTARVVGHDVPTDAPEAGPPPPPDD